MCLIVALFVIAAVFAAWFLIALGTVLGLLPWILAGLIAGWVASTLTESPHGILGDIVIGLAGSFVGGVLFTAITHQRVVGVLNPTHLIVATIGSVILLVFVKVMAGNKT